MPARLTPLDAIAVPPPRPDETYSCEGPDGPIHFVGLKRLLGAADFPKAGDRHAGLAAPDDLVREAARRLLAGLTVGHVHERPLLTADGRVDDVMRVNYDVDHGVLAEIAGLTFGALKDRLLPGSGTEAVRLRADEAGDVVDHEGIVAPGEAVAERLGGGHVDPLVAAVGELAPLAGLEVHDLRRRRAERAAVAHRPKAPVEEVDGDVELGRQRGLRAGQALEEDLDRRAALEGRQLRAHVGRRPCASAAASPA